MNIFHLRASNFYGGPERQLHLHALQARESKFNVVIGSFNESGKRPEFLEVIGDDDIATYAFDVKNAYDPKAVRLLRGYLISNKIRILCTHDYRTHLIGFLASIGIDTKWIAFSRGWTAESLKVKIYHLLDKIIVRFSDHMVAVSGSQKNKLLRILVPAGKISVVHNAMEPDRIAAFPKIDLHTRFGFPEDSIICICGGRFSREKGHIYLVRAAALALEKNSSLRFVLFGDGPELGRVRKAIARRGLENHILCPGFERDLIGCLKGAEVLINPSLSEGLPNIVLEAMALRLPVIATMVGGVPELIIDGESGFLVPPADETALARAILRFFGGSENKNKIVSSAFEIIVSRFSFETQMQKLAGIYNLVGGEERKHH